MTSEIGVLEKLKGYFESKSNVCFASLFGSYATGKTYAESDIDVAVYLKEGYSLESIKKVWRELEGLLERDVDLLILNTAPPLVGYAAMRGKTIVVNDYRMRLDYVLRVSQEAEDFREFFLDLWSLRERIKATGHIK